MLVLSLMRLPVLTRVTAPLSLVYHEWKHPHSVLVAMTVPDAAPFMATEDAIVHISVVIAGVEAVGSPLRVPVGVYTYVALWRLRQHDLILLWQLL